MKEIQTSFFLRFLPALQFKDFVTILVLRATITGIGKPRETGQVYINCISIGLAQMGFMGAIYLLPKTKKAVTGQWCKAWVLSLHLDRSVAKDHTCSLSWQVPHILHLNFLICKVKITGVPSSPIYSED